MATSSAESRALRLAIDFLLDERIVPEPGSSSAVCSGLRAWRDFDLHVGESDEWVTAYTSCALAGTGDRSACAAAAEACSFLVARAHDRTPGFGYNKRTTRDADSSAWACRLATAVNRQDECFSGALRFLQSCRQHNGGIATYPSEAAVREAIRVSPEMPVGAWASSHVCVSAATATLPVFSANAELRGYLRNSQTLTGEWRGYWWADAEYATALAIEALSRGATGGDASCIARAVAWLEQTPVCRSPFTVALRVLALRLAERTAPAILVDELLRTQRADGSWTASARLRLPFPGMRHPDRHWDWDYSEKSFGGMRLDERRVFTTATAVRALATCTCAGAAK